MKKLDFFSLFAGVCLIVIGYGIYDEQYSRSYRYGVVDYGPYHDLIGIFIMAVGVFIIGYRLLLHYKGK